MIRLSESFSNWVLLVGDGVTSTSIVDGLVVDSKRISLRRGEVHLSSVTIGIVIIHYYKLMRY